MNINHFSTSKLACNHLFIFNLCNFLAAWNRLYSWWRTRVTSTEVQ